MINPSIDFKRVQNEYAERKRVVIQDFLRADAAEELFESFDDLTRRNIWYQANIGNHKHYDPRGGVEEHFCYKFEKFPLKNIPLKTLIGAEGDSRRLLTEELKGLAAEPEAELAGTHPMRRVADFFNSEECHAFISKLNGKTLTPGRAICFASKYTAGDYNALHNDGSLPRVSAFVLNMTKNWLVHWGGNLVILDEKARDIVETVMPRFNSLIVFDVPLPHAVLPVSIFAQAPRLAVTGWFQRV